MPPLEQTLEPHVLTHTRLGLCEAWCCPCSISQDCMGSRTTARRWCPVARGRGASVHLPLPGPWTSLPAGAVELGTDTVGEGVPEASYPGGPPPTRFKRAGGSRCSRQGGPKVGCQAGQLKPPLHPPLPRAVVPTSAGPPTAWPELASHSTPYGPVMVLRPHQAVLLPPP